MRSLSDMSETLAPPTAAAVLLVALEPCAPRGRIEAALVLLGHRADAVGEATTRGLVRISGERLEVVDTRVARLVAQAATDRERRLAHLALACSRARRTIGYDARSVFDSLSGALDGSVPLPLPSETGEADTKDHRDPLTPREQKVAELAASGLPTREIAAASYLSQKTVEYHLTRVYRKLGVRSKSELVFALAGRPVPVGH
jgi:DNA-binding CsgD family transcriptional regulator